MKTIWQYIAIAALAVSAAACTPEYPVPNAGKLPQASDLDVTINVDQETNYVTFVMNNKGVVPVWIFGDQKIDGKAGKKYSYTENNVSLRFRDAGEYTVEVKAYNANGISQGSLVKTFTMNNTYRDPFDPSPYIKAISGGSSQSWEWNHSENGHFGCGPVGEPLGWWSCGAEEKAGFLYDDIMTFSADGKYTFNPGDGKAYANKGSEYKAEFKTGDEDYLFDTAEKTTGYSFENNWNDAGIEEIYLVLESGSELSYVPHKSIVDEPRYLVMESKTANMKKKIQLMATVFTPDNTDGISWYYEFIPQGSVVGAADPLYGYESKVWVLDNESVGYMGCGPDAGNPLGWWTAQPHEKDAFGLTDDELTFFKDGKYIFDPGADGLVYCNWESGYLPDGHTYSGDGSTDYNAPAGKQESTYTLGSDGNGDYIELPAGIFFSYVPRPEVLTQPTKLYIKENTADKLVLVPSFEGIISWQLIFRPKDGGEQPSGDEADFDIDGPGNMWNSMTYEMSFYTSHGPNWEELPNSGFEADDTKHVYTVDMPEATDNQWQRQVAFHTSMSSSVDKTYDFCCTITPTKDLPGVTFKLVLDGGGDNDKIFYFEERLPLNAGEDYVYKKSNMPGIDMNKIALFFDFGGNAEDTQAVIKDICFQEHKGGSGPSPADDDIESVLVGSWTWNPDVNGHFGCGPDLGNPTGWWSGDANCKTEAFMYNDVITFTADGKYTLDPVDGKSYINKDVTVYNDLKTGECPYGDDFVIGIDKITVSYDLDEIDDRPVIKLAEGGMFSYTPNNDFADEPWLYVKSFSKDELVLMSYTATGNGGGSIAWQYILKRVK